MKYKLSRESKNYTGKKNVKQKIAALLSGVALASMLGGCSNMKTLRLDSLYVFTDANGEHKICELLHDGKTGIREVLTGERYTDEFGNEALYKSDIFSLAGEMCEDKKYFDEDKTYLPTEAGIPLEEVWPEAEQYQESYRHISVNQVAEICSNIDEYMSDYLSNRVFPLYSQINGYGETITEKSLLVYSKMGTTKYGYNEQLQETVVGYGVWAQNDSGDFYIDKDFFIDITDNSLKSVYDENGVEQYRCMGTIDTILGGNSNSNRDAVYTASQIDEIRERYHRYNWPDYEFQPLFVNEEKTVSFAEIEELACDGESIDKKELVKDAIKRAIINKEEKQVE